jgi:type VI protein secretion system component Hcp
LKASKLVRAAAAPTTISEEELRSVAGGSGSPLSITKEVDAASPKLAQSTSAPSFRPCCAGTHYATVTLTLR